MTLLRSEHLENSSAMETKPTKTIDAVEIMRDIRNKIAHETQNMTLGELKKYIADRLKHSSLKNIGR